MQLLDIDIIWVFFSEYYPPGFLNPTMVLMTFMSTLLNYYFFTVVIVQWLIGSSLGSEELKWDSGVSPFNLQTL